jgi:hypothetical protein
MYCAASRSVISGFRPGNGIGLSNFASYSNSNPTEPGFRCETLDRFLSRKPRLAVDAKPEKDRHRGVVQQMKTLLVGLVVIFAFNTARAEESAPSRIDNITKS